MAISSKPTSGQSSGEVDSPKSAFGQGYLWHGDLSTLICAPLAVRQLPSSDNSPYRPAERADLVTHAIILPTSHAPDSRNDPRAV